jgi:3-methyladenine DNA glycosylase AlkD
MTVEEIREELFHLQDTQYRDFQSKVTPTIDPTTLIGVRTPELRKYAKQLLKDDEADDFLQALPHDFFDENQLHAFILSEMRNFATCLDAVDRFLPYVDNWATCDQLSPKVFKKHKPKLLDHINRWMASDQTYTVRFGIGMLMQHYLDDESFDPAYPKAVAAIRSEEYYVKMMVAWYFATALAKQWDAVIPYLEQRELEPWTHNKAIQKAVESRRITQEQKDYLRGCKHPSSSKRRTAS